MIPNDDTGAHMNLKQIQALLSYLGYYDGQLDGIWGRLSEEAAVAMQRDYGLVPSMWMW